MGNSNAEHATPIGQSLSTGSMFNVTSIVKASGEQFCATLIIESRQYVYTASDTVVTCREFTPQEADLLKPVQAIQLEQPILHLCAMEKKLGILMEDKILILSYPLHLKRTIKLTNYGFFPSARSPFLAYESKYGRLALSRIEGFVQVFTDSYNLPDSSCTIELRNLTVLDMLPVNKHVLVLGLDYDWSHRLLLFAEKSHREAAEFDSSDIKSSYSFQDRPTRMAALTNGVVVVSPTHLYFLSPGQTVELDDKVNPAVVLKEGLVTLPISWPNWTLLGKAIKAVTTIYSDDALARVLAVTEDGDAAIIAVQTKVLALKAILIQGFHFLSVRKKVWATSLAHIRGNVFYASLKSGTNGLFRILKSGEIDPLLVGKATPPIQHILVIRNLVPQLLIARGGPGHGMLEMLPGLKWNSYVKASVTDEGAVAAHLVGDNELWIENLEGRGKLLTLSDNFELNVKASDYALEKPKSFADSWKLESPLSSSVLVEGSCFAVTWDGQLLHGTDGESFSTIGDLEVEGHTSSEVIAFPNSVRFVCATADGQVVAAHINMRAGEISTKRSFFSSPGGCTVERFRSHLFVSDFGGIYVVHYDGSGFSLEQVYEVSSCKIISFAVMNIEAKSQDQLEFIRVAIFTDDLRILIVNIVHDQRRQNFIEFPAPVIKVEAAVEGIIALVAGTPNADCTPQNSIKVYELINLKPKEFPCGSYYFGTFGVNGKTFLTVESFKGNGGVLILSLDDLSKVLLQIPMIPGLRMGSAVRCSGNLLRMYFYGQDVQTVEVGYEDFKDDDPIKFNVQRLRMTKLRGLASCIAFLDEEKFFGLKGIQIWRDGNLMSCQLAYQPKYVALMLGIDSAKLFVYGDELGNIGARKQTPNGFRQVLACNVGSKVTSLALLTEKPLSFVAGLFDGSLLVFSQGNSYHLENLIQVRGMKVGEKELDILGIESTNLSASLD